MIRQAISELVLKRDLSTKMMKEVMNQIMQGQATQAQMGAFLVALRLKGESIEEIAASVEVMREKANKIHVNGDVLDIVGTGGDCSNTFNVSTITAIVVSAAGYPVAKHGNRSVSSKCGSADLLEALGVKIDLSIEKNQKVFDEIGLCFMFAPLYHTSMKYVAGVRKEMAIRTIFNIIGPLSNPANANLQLLGVFDRALVEPLARVLIKLGVKRGLVVWGHDGLDEASLCSDTSVCEFDIEKYGDQIMNYVIKPEDFGLEKCSLEALVGGDPKRNAEIALDILKGAKGPMRDMVILNSVLSLHLADCSLSFEEAFKLASEVIDSGKGLARLEKFAELTNS